MPKCVACGKRKGKEEFRKGRVKCKACCSAGAQTYKANRRRQTRAKVFAYLREHPCVDCGEADIAVLEFDHREQHTKEFRVSERICQGYGWDTIEKEIAKCDVRCANCHRRRTAKQLGWYAADAARR